jgi:phosphoribosylaminoimidazole-succinocarboxamide synthase
MTMLRSDLPLKKINQGKVRDVYAVDADRLLLVATDRISAFDVVMGEAVPDKGRVLTQMSAWWFKQFTGVVDHHMLSADTDEIVRAVPAIASHREAIEGRATLCRRTTVFPKDRKPFRRLAKDTASISPSPTPAIQS